MSTGYYRPMPPKPRPIRPAPPDARADALVLNVGAAPIDTNKNDYPDLIRATAHLFDTRYPPAIREDGVFVFHLYAAGEVSLAGAQPIRTWRIDDTQERLLTRSAFGECYQFRLSLLADGGDTLAITAADLVCWFEPADGREPIYAGEISQIKVGSRVLLPQQYGWRLESVFPMNAGGGAGTTPQP